MTELSGVHVALATAFDDHGSLDLAGCAALADDLIGRGVHGLVVNGSTGEFASLTVDERRAAVEAVTEVTDQRVPVTVQVGAISTREAVAHAEHARATGAAVAEAPATHA